MPIAIDQIKTLQLEITTYCNAKCPHCPRFSEDGSGHLAPSVKLQHWDIPAVVANLEVEKMTLLERIIIEGDKGDPVMHPKLYDLLVYFSQAPSHPIVELTTNGSIQSAKWWTKIAAIPNLIVRFSIDGLKDTNHLYRVGTDFDRIVANAQAFISAGGNALMKTLLFKHNEHQIDELIQFSLDMGFFAIWFMRGDLGRFLGLPVWPVQIDGQVIHTIEPSNEYKNAHNIIHRSIPKYEQVLGNELDVHDFICPNLTKGRLYIAYQQHVIPCCMMHNDLYLDYPSGRRLINEIVGDIDSIDLSKHKMSAILTSSLFNNRLEDHFYNGRHLPTCTKSCKSQIVSRIEFRKNS